MTEKLFDIELQTIEGEGTTLSEYRGQVLLIVNTASQCGLTPQYQGLESLYEKYGAEGLVILGFPCNQFGRQEPGSNSEIAAFCTRRFGVSFPMFARVEVNGSDTHPLYQELKQAAPGLLGSTRIKWNFTKFLVNRSGRVVKRFAPHTKPAAIESAVRSLLKS
jgi:glutathione peroxidase